MQALVPLGDARACNADGTIIGGERLEFGSPDLVAWIRIGDQPGIVVVSRLDRDGLSKRPRSGGR